MGIQTIPAASGGVTQKVQVFTSTGSFVTPSNTSAVEVFLVGGGGGGGGTGGTAITSGGGGGGGVIRRLISVTPGTTYTVTVGAGGAGGSSSGTSGANGSDTSFGSLAIAYGGGFGGGNNTSNEVDGGIRATAGGMGGVNNSFSGGGAAAFWGPAISSTTPYILDYISGSQGSPKTLYSGGFVSSSSITVGGFGIEGYGGGGNRGPSGTSQRPQFVSIHGGGTGSYNQAGGNGTANLGGGGGGAYKDPTAVAGGNGGSGYATVTYWS
jgi:hypothetical protein